MNSLGINGATLVGVRKDEWPEVLNFWRSMVLFDPDTNSTLVMAPQKLLLPDPYIPTGSTKPAEQVEVQAMVVVLVDHVVAWLTPEMTNVGRHFMLTHSATMNAASAKTFISEFAKGNNNPLIATEAKHGIQKTNS